MNNAYLNHTRYLRKFRHAWLRLLAVGIVSAAGAASALAAEWKPDRTIEIIVATGPGSGVDNTARTLQAIMQTSKLIEHAVGHEQGGRQLWRRLMGPKGLSAEQIRYWDGVFQRLVKTQGWKDAVEKNQWEEDYMNSAELGKNIKAQYDILKHVLSELGMIAQ